MFRNLAKGVLFNVIEMPVEVRALPTDAVCDVATIADVFVAEPTFGPIPRAQGLQHDLAVAMRARDDGPFLERAPTRTVIDQIPAFQTALGMSHRQACPIKVSPADA